MQLLLLKQPLIADSLLTNMQNTHFFGKMFLLKKYWDESQDNGTQIAERK